AISRRGARPDVSGRPALAAFLRLDARLGPRGRAGGETIAELGRRLGLVGEAAAAFDVVERECYAAAPPGEGVEAAGVLDRVAPG
ncbi:MAG: hypothetical protein M3N21_04300, partial [Actinomycetota bacterium]|nr:hypothetical protein [Actinomycetota bacterium]